MLKTVQSLANPREAYGEARKVAIIDVGSNSFRLIVITYVPRFYFQVTDEVREAVRLVQGLGQTGQLSGPAMDRAVEVMRLYRSFCDAQEITEIIAVATSAVREARNQAEFLERVRHEAGIEVRVLSGDEEAYYGYLAAVNCTTVTNGHVIDLGGGSLEITRVKGRRNLESSCMTLGAVRTTEDWLPQAPTDKEAIERLNRHLRKEFDALEWFKAGSHDSMVAEGGSLRNLARIIQKMSGHALEELHGYTVQREELRKLIRIMTPLSVEGRRVLPGMKPDRADIALAAAVVIEALMRHAGYEQLTVCSQGVREGLFYERFLADVTPPMFSDVRRASVMNIAHLYHFHEKHVDHVEQLALSMFDQIRDDPLCGPDERDLLWAACMLHDIGMTIDYNDHHRHSHYLILNSGLPGYTHRELALIALAARYHRKGEPSADELTDALAEDDDKRLQKLTALLRLAEQLDRSRDGSVRSVRLRMGESAARLEVFSKQDISVALWSAQNHVDLFEKAFGRPLEIAHVQ